MGQQDMVKISGESSATASGKGAGSDSECTSSDSDADDLELLKPSGESNEVPSAASIRTKAAALRRYSIAAENSKSSPQGKRKDGPMVSASLAGKQTVAQVSSSYSSPSKDSHSIRNVQGNSIAQYSGKEHHPHSVFHRGDHVSGKHHSSDSRFLQGLNTTNPLDTLDGCPICGQRFCQHTQDE